jgi:hypothetical protein
MLSLAKLDIEAAEAECKRISSCSSLSESAERSEVNDRCRWCEAVAAAPLLVGELEAAATALVTTAPPKRMGRDIEEAADELTEAASDCEGDENKSERGLSGRSTGEAAMGPVLAALLPDKCTSSSSSSSSRSVLKFCSPYFASKLTSLILAALTVATCSVDEKGNLWAELAAGAAANCAPRRTREEAKDEEDEEDEEEEEVLRASGGDCVEEGDRNSTVSVDGDVRLVLRGAEEGGGGDRGGGGGGCTSPSPTSGAATLNPLTV